MSQKDKEKATKLLREGHLEEAYRILNKILPKYPDDWLIYDDLSYIEKKLYNNLEQAKVFLEKAKERGLPKSRYHRCLGDIFWREGQKEKAVKEFEMAVNLDSSIDNLEALANGLMHTDYERAYPIWQNIIEKEPNNFQAYSSIIWIAGKRGDQKSAFEMVKKGLSMNPNEPEFLFYAGRTYQGFGRYREAINYYLKAKENGYLDEVAFHKGIAICYFELHSYEKAFEYAHKAFELSSEDAYKDEFFKNFKQRILWLCGDGERVDEETYKALSISLKIWPEDCILLAYLACFEMRHKKNYELGKYYMNKAFQFPGDSLDLLYEIKGALWFDYLNAREEGLSYLEKAVSLNRTNFNLTALAFRLMEINPKKAEELYHEVIKSDPEYADAFFGLAEIAFEKEEWTKGIELAEKGYNLRPNAPKFSALLGYGYFNKGNFEKSLDYYHESEKLGFNDMEYLYLSIAYCHQKLSQHKKMIEYAEKVLQLNPENQEAKTLLSSIE